MTEIRGRPLGACAALLMMWTAMRIGMADTGPITGPTMRGVQTAQKHAITAISFLPTYTLPYADGEAAPRSAILGLSSTAYTNWPALFNSEPKRVARNQGSISSGLQLAGIAPPQSDLGQALESIIAKPSQPNSPGISEVVPTAFPPKKANRMTFYAYSFWRPGLSGDQTATVSQYGGSQNGLIATYRLTEQDWPDISLLLRGAVTPGQFADKEVAVGVRVRPFANLPITLSAERRFRTRNENQFALYAAGSTDNVALLPGLEARGFAQAGIIPAKNPNIFFDAGMRAETKVYTLGKTETSIGAGAWAGGQRGVSRLDIGPTIRSNIDLGVTKIDISADWRFRVGGNASPKNGPAITISAGF